MDHRRLHRDLTISIAGAWDLLRSMKEQINLAIKEDRLKPNEGMRLLAEHEKGLTERTYLTVPGK